MLISDWSSDECSSDLDRPPMDDRTVLVVDEASTLADRDLAALLTMVERTGATVRLIGDADQHGAVAAGGLRSDARRVGEECVCSRRSWGVLYHENTKSVVNQIDKQVLTNIEHL